MSRISLLAIAKPGEDVGRNLAMSEDGYCRLERSEVSLHRHLRLSRHDTLTHPLGDRFQMHAERIDAGVLHSLKPGVVVGRLALSLDRKIDRGFDPPRAFAKDFGTTVAARRRSGCHHHMGNAIKLDSCAGDFGELLRRLAFNGTAGGEGLADGAELAGLGAALIPDAGLQDRRRQHVAAVQRCNFRIGNAVSGRALVKARPQLEFHFADHGAVAADLAAAQRIGFVDDVRTLECRRIVDRIITVAPSIVIGM